jgi:hypothetical protein
MDALKVSKVLAKFFKKRVFQSKKALLGPENGRVFLGSHQETTFEHSNVFVCTSYMTGLLALYIVVTGYGAINTTPKAAIFQTFIFHFFAHQRVRRSWYNST